MIVYRTPGLSGLEIWHGVSRSVTLFQLRESKREYFQGLCDFLVRMHDGSAYTEDPGDTWGLQRAAGFERVLFCGGEAQHPLLEQVLEQALVETGLPFAFEIERTGEFAARWGALRIFEEMGWQRGVALDLGQTQLKVITASACRSIARDPGFLPVGRDALAPETGRARLRDFIAQAVLPAVPAADGVVFALPVSLDSEGVAQPATYPGLCGPVEPLFAGLFPMPWVVVNDAVLAANGFPPENGEKTLVVTLGFGIGGALWHA